MTATKTVCQKCGVQIKNLKHSTKCGCGVKLKTFKSIV